MGKLLTHLREGLKDVGHHLERRLPACVMLVRQLSNHKVHMMSELLPQRVVQHVL